MEISNSYYSTVSKSKDYYMVPQSSDPIENVADEAVHKELGDSLVRAATTASSLEAEQDSGNINKTQSKATPNESSSLGTTSGGGPRCQETMGDTIAQTRFENVSKHSNDSLLARGNTLQSDEDRLKLDELMALCTTLQNRVLDLEKTKTTQHNEIASLKRRVKKLEKKNRSRTHKLKRLYKVGLTARVESSDNEESLGEDASKQGRIDAIDADEEITLVSVQNVDEEMFDVNVLDGEEVFVAEQEVVVKDVNNEVNVAEEVVEVINSANAATTTTPTITTVDDITLAQALIEIKSTKPKEKGVVIQELGESITIISSQLSSQQSQDKGKGILIEPMKPIKKKDLIRLDEEAALNLQAGFDEQERLTREKVEKEKEANIALIKTWDDIQEKIDKIFYRAFMRMNTFVDFRTNLVEGSSKRAGKELEQESTKKQKVDEDKDTVELQSLMKVIPDEEEVAIVVVPLANKPPTIVDWKIHKEGKKIYYQIVRADGNALLEFEIWNDLHAGRKEISPYTTYYYRYTEQEASVFETAGEVTTASTKLLLLEEVTIAKGSYYWLGELRRSEIKTENMQVVYSLASIKVLAIPKNLIG
ncbi:hypothetical protein Tco_0164730 [Tanacetum coccineum]